MKIYFSILIFSISIAICAQDIKINDIDPASYGYPGEKIYILGVGFGNDKSKLKVTFGATAGNIVQATDRRIAVRVPTGATYDNITVTNLATGKSAKSSKTFLMNFGGKEFNPTSMKKALEKNTGPGLYDLCLCDFNNNGKADIATALRGSNFISILENKSNINRLNINDFSQRAKGKTIAITCGDLDGDGRPDILLSKNNNPANIIYVLKNIGQGRSISFAQPKTLTIKGVNPKKIQVADLNRDGKPEIIVTNAANNKINVFINKSTNANLQFDSTPKIIKVPGISNASGLKVTDLNNDGFPDIVVTPFLNRNQKFYILQNKGKKNKIAFNSPIAITGTMSMISVQVGDFDFDNKPDIAITNFDLNTSHISVFLNKSPKGGIIAFGSENRISTNGRKKKWGLDLGDLNGDGKLDIVVSSINDDNILDVFINNTAGPLSFKNYTIKVPQNIQNVKIGDINGDAKPDIVYAGIKNDHVGFIINNHCMIPSIKSDNTNDVCTGGQISLKATKAPATLYEWMKSDGNKEWQVKLGNQPFYKETPTSSGDFTYRVIAIQKSCKESSEKVNVKIKVANIPKLTSIHFNGQTVCEGKNFKLEAKGDFAATPQGVNFQWTKPDKSTVNTTTNILTIDDAKPSDAGEYAVKIVIATCESNVVKKNISVTSTKNVEISASNGLAFCKGGSTTLSVPHTAGNRYAWYVGKETQLNSISHLLNVNTAGTYYAIITTASGCSISTSSVTVQETTPPTANFELPNTGCTAQAIQFKNTSKTTPGSTAKYTWQFGEGNTSNEQNPEHTYDRPGEYTVKLTVSYGDDCKNTKLKKIKVAQATVISIAADGPTEFCKGGKVKLSVLQGLKSYLWNDASNSTSPTIEVSESKTYSVTATNANGCPSTAEIEVIVHAPPTINIEIKKIKGSTTLEATGAIRYEWKKDPTLQGNDKPNPTVNPEVTTTYYVKGYDENGCSGSASIIVEVNASDAISKFFTPNNDGQNDRWLIKNVKQFANCTIVVFNRSGQVVFESKNYNNDWDGTNKGKELNEGVYYYVVKCEDSTTASITGSVTILR